MPYFTNVGPGSGPILQAYGYRTLDVFEDPGDATPIGTAQPVGSTPWGIAVWAITVRGKAVLGRWVVLGREFMPRT
jgi:hypothetical protein